MEIKNIKEIDYSEYMVEFLPDGITKCVVCNNEFKSRSVTHKYCSNFCKNRRNREPRVGNINKTCLCCGKEFKATRSHAKWCSKLCASRGKNKIHIKKDSPKNIKRNYPLGESNCLNCNAVYTKKTYRHKYCSSDCKVEDRKRIEREESLKNRPYIRCRECGIICKPVKKDGVTCGKEPCVSESRRKFKLTNDLAAKKPGGHRYEQFREYQNNYIKHPKNNLSKRIRSGVRNALKGKRKKSKTFDSLDFTIDELFEHLEKQFVDGMGWHNMSEWHIDHIIPIAAFNYETNLCPEFKTCWALGNLRPMWAKDNLRKNDKIPGVDYI